MKCVDCGSQCRNHCSSCGKGYCANCRDASRSATCSHCRAAKATKRQQAKAAQKQSRIVQASTTTPAYTPPPALASYANVQPGVQGAPLPATQVAASAPVSKRAPRKMLTLMDAGEFKVWQRRTIEALEDAKARGEAYLARRSARGTRASTDIAMERDQVLYEDLLVALEEIETLWEWAQVQGGQGGQDDIIPVTQYDKLQP